VLVTGLGGIACGVLFVVHEARTKEPMLPLSLFRSRNFAVGNITTLSMYAGLGGMMFLLGLFIQQVAGYSALEAGLAFLPLTAITFLLAKRFGALSDRYGPRLFMSVGPIVAGLAMLMLMRVDDDADYLTQLLPAIVVFGLGLAIVVAPVTATVLAAAPDRFAGVASGVNNAVARSGSLLAVAVLPAVAGLSGSAYADPGALTEGWRMACWVCAGLTAVGGVIALGVRNDVLGPAQPAVVEAAPVASAHPKPGDCFTCGVEAPPTHIRPDRERAA
jgi:MFS family permease